MKGFFWWMPFGTAPEISAADLDLMIRSGSQAPQILDVRTGTEWRASRIAGAINVPFTELDERMAELQLDAARPIVAICRSAHRSIPAVRVLHEHGFKNARQLKGGMLAWWKAKLPVVGNNAGDA